MAAPKKIGYLLKSDLVFTSAGKEIKAHGEFILPEDNSNWTSLVETKDGVTLLGKLVSIEKDVMHLDYIVVDTKRTNAVVSMPSVLVKLGEAAEVTTEQNSEKIKVTILAKKTDFTVLR
jgi:hypothetical protein